MKNEEKEDRNTSNGSNKKDKNQQHENANDCAIGNTLTKPLREGEICECINVDMREIEYLLCIDSRINLSNKALKVLISQHTPYVI
jgi:hypothetical protein